MASLIKGQPNTTAKINWFITIDSALNDAYEIGFRILDIASGLPGTQIFPLTPGEYEDVTAAPGHFGTGRYYAYNNTTGTPWTPGEAISLGTHRIVWRWKIDVAAAYQTGQEDFEILEEDGVAPTDTYIVVQDIRDLGIVESVVDDAAVLAAIELWQQFIERATRQWFLPKILVIRFDGNDSDAIHFGVPVISIDYLKINDQETLLDAVFFKVYNARCYPDDRRNPRIKLRNEQDLDIFTAPIVGRRLRFRKGRQNQEVKGTFGFTEEDGSVPLLIKRALSKLVIEKLTNPIYHDPSVSPALVSAPPLTGNLLEEWSDGHKRKWGAAGGELKSRNPGMTGITDDQEILDIVRLYKAPIGIATPAHPSHS